MTRARGALALLLVLFARSLSAGPYDPRLRFRTITTTHFVIHFHTGEERAAERLARIAEEVNVRLAEALGYTPRGRTEIILVDQEDRSNGSATVLPWKAIRIDAAPPTGVEQLGNTDDWLRYVFTHEYAHVLHLDRSSGWARLARAVLGRSEIAFPNLTLPLWQIEGFATLVESESGEGRLHAGDFREIVDEASRAGRFEPLDRVNGGLMDWPSGDGWYAYGARFHEFLVERYGEARVVQLADRTSGRLPFLTSGAFRAVYGKSLGDLWAEFRAWVATRVPPTVDGNLARLTHRGFVVDGPRIDRDGQVWFSAADPNGFPGLYRVSLGGETTHICRRNGGGGLTLGAAVVIFDQLEFVRGTGLQSDLYALDRRTLRVRRLTRGARLVEPDLSPDGRRLAAVEVRGGSRALVVLDTERVLTSPRPLGPSDLMPIARLGDGDDVYASPRWSPDGAMLATEHRRRGGRSQVVVTSSDGHDPRVVVESIGRNVTPDWTSDGTALVFASDRAGGPFALYRVSLRGQGFPSELVYSPPGGATTPAVARDGRCVFVGYTVDGYDLFETQVGMSTIASEQVGSAPVWSQQVESSQPVSDSPAVPGARTYSPWSTFAPRGWMPLVDERDDRWHAGAFVVATDVLGRHVATASVSWALTSGDVPAGGAPRARPDWTASYAYSRWQTVPFAAVDDHTHLFNALDAESSSVIPVSQREQNLDVGLWRAFRRVRWTGTATAAFHREVVTTTVPGEVSSRDRSAARAAWTLLTAREYGYSISLEDGVGVSLTAEAARPALGSDGRGDALAMDARAYVPLGWGRSVLAMRTAAAGSSGDRGVRRLFRLGGADSNAALGAFGSDAITLLRGFENEVFSGTHVALTNVEWRVPLAYPQRGVGTWPLFVRSVHLAAFVDVGHAWTGEWRWRDRKTGVGLELSTDVTAGFGLPLTWTAGVGWGHDGGGQLPDQRSIYLRVGRSF
jgi:hypothetical protein